MRHIIHLALYLALGVLLSGCEGSDGSAGAAGPAGPVGPPGPAGPPAPVPSAAFASAQRIHVELTAVQVSSGTAPPTVELRLRDERGFPLAGLPAANIAFVLARLQPGLNGSASRWRSYVSRNDGGVSNAQAATETASATRWVDNSDGSYRYTFAQGVAGYSGAPAFDPTLTHRLGVEVRTSTNGFLPSNVPADNAPFDFVPNGSEATFTRAIVGNAVCNACHDNLEAHGEARFDVAYCVQCHNPSSIDGNTGNSVDMTVMIHKIHYGERLSNGYAIVGRGNVRNDYSHVVYSQDVRNCRTCHDASNAATPDAGNWQLVATRNACGSCHDNIDWMSGTAGHPGGLVFADDSQCNDCHGPLATVNNGEVQTARVHAIPADLASAEFAFNILAISDAAVGRFPRATISVTNPLQANAPYNLATAPEFTACADGTSRLAVDFAWSAAHFTNPGTPNAPSQPVSVNALTGPGCGGAATRNADGTYDVVSPVALPAGVTGTMAVAVEGHPWKDLNHDGVSGITERIAVTNAIEYAGIDGAVATPRRDRVAIDKCNDCHNRLSIHGNNRTDQPQVCVTCHNPNATDVNRHGNVNGACFQALGDVDVPIDFKYMIHALHAGARANYAVCGFGNSIVRYDTLVYPGRLNNCEGCHLPNTYYPVAASAALGTTVRVGDDAANPRDDMVISPNTASCSSCHVDALARAHMQQNGGDFAATKTATSALISTGVETCELCHGPGRVADVKTLHGVARFNAN